MISRAQEALIEMWCRELDKYGYDFVDLSDCLERPYSVSIPHLAIAYHFINRYPSIQMLGDLVISELKNKDCRATFSIFHKQCRKRLPKSLLKKLPADFKAYEDMEDRAVNRMVNSLMQLSNPKENQRVHGTQQSIGGID